MNTETKGRLARVINAARAWAPTMSTRTSSGLRDALESAAKRVTDEDLAELESVGPPAYVALHGKALQDVLNGLEEVMGDRDGVYALEIMTDAEGVKFRLNGGPSWGPGFGEPRGSQ